MIKVVKFETCCHQQLPHADVAPAPKTSVFFKTRLSHSCSRVRRHLECFVLRNVLWLVTLIKAVFV